MAVSKFLTDSQVVLKVVEDNKKLSTIFMLATSRLLTTKFFTLS